MKTFGKMLLILIAILVAAFLYLRVPDTDPEEMRAKYGAAPSQFVELDSGLTVHLRDEGPSDAPAIILLHGSNADLHTWGEWADDLKQDYRVIRFDQIGHGLTGPASDDDYSLDAYVSGVDAVADTLELGKFVLAGNSMGGWIAAGYAMEHPERLSGLVLVDAGGAPTMRETSGNLAFTIARLPGIGAVMSQMLPRSIVERSLSQSVSNQEIVTPEAVDRYWEMARYPGNRAASRIRFSQSRTPFTPEQVAAISTPTLILWGEEDTLISVEAAGWYAEHLPTSQTVIYKGVGHIPMEENPQQSISDFRNWLTTAAFVPEEA